MLTSLFLCFMSLVSVTGSYRRKSPKSAITIYITSDHITRQMIHLLLCFTGMRSRTAQVPKATNFCLWAAGKTSFFHISLILRIPWLGDNFGLLMIFVRLKPYFSKIKKPQPFYDSYIISCFNKE